MKAKTRPANSTGISRISNAFKMAPETSAEDTLSFMVNDFFSFIGTDVLGDDFTAILLKRIV